MSYLPWLIWVSPLVGALLTPVLAKANARLRDLAAVSFTLIAALSATATALTVSRGDYQVEWIPSLGIKAGELVDPLSIFMANIVSWISLLIMVYSLEYMKGDSGLTRYWFFMTLVISHRLVLILAEKLMIMFFG